MVALRVDAPLKQFNCKYLTDYLQWLKCKIRGGGTLH